jgi:hypothetical protein
MTIRDRRTLKGSVVYGACAALLLAGLAGSGALAQGKPAAKPVAAGPGDILVRSSVKGATAVAQPGPETPVPAWAQQSWNDYLAMKAKAKGGTRYTRADYAKMPDWSGVWKKVYGFAWDENIVPVARTPHQDAAQAITEHCSSFPCANYMTADLKPAYALRYREKLAAGVQNIIWDDLSQCLPAGFPRDLLGAASLRDFIVTPDETWIYFQQDQGNRNIFTDGRGHRPESEAYPLWTGDSVGFWDGDTLVVHTLYIVHEELGQTQPAVSKEASVIERIRMTGPDTIEDTATLYDPQVLNKPWTGTQTYIRDIDHHARNDLYNCEANNNVYQNADGSTNFILPGETIMMPVTYKEPETIKNVGVEKVIATGAKLLAEQEAKKAAADKAKVAENHK